jgi:hypothetical protein
MAIGDDSAALNTIEGEIGDWQRLTTRIAPARVQGLRRPRPGSAGARDSWPSGLDPPHLWR